MFDETPSLIPSSVERTVYANQTAVTVYENPSADSSEVLRIPLGEGFRLLPSNPDDEAAWLRVSTASNVRGFIRAATKVLSSAEAQARVNTFNSAVKLGWSKLALGLILVAAGVILTITMSKAGSGVQIWYGMVLVGLGSFGWGFEQVVYARKSIMKFRSVFGAALVGDRSSNQRTDG